MIIRKHTFHFLFPVFFLLTTACLSAFAQEQSNTSPGKKNIFWQQFHDDSLWSFRAAGGYFPMLLHNYGEQATAVFHMSAKQGLYLAGWAGLTAVLMNNDNAIDSKFKPLKDKHVWIDQISPEITELGNTYGYIFMAGMAGYGLVFKKHKAFHTALLASQAALTAGTWTFTGKLLTGRMRPGITYNDPEYPKGHWFGPFAYLQPKYSKNRSIASFDAFPSGHTSTAFSIATVYAMRYRDQRAIPFVAYTLAGLVAITRLTEHEHWASDLVPGALVGYLCGRQVVRHYEKTFSQYAERQKPKRTDSNLFFGAGNGGFSFRYSLLF